MFKLVGGRKMLAFFSCLIAIVGLAVFDKAHSHVLTSIDGLLLFLVGSNVAAKKVNPKNEQA
tara:strand:- start:39 stop:224 length:186 start_codon:yes stop_codon:yes gene_type:complete